MKKILPPDEIKEFKQDWEIMTCFDIRDKYHIGTYVMYRWAKQLNCSFPKPECRSKPKSIITSKPITPQDIMKKIKNLDIQDIGIVKELLEKFNEIGQSDIPAKEKDAQLMDLANKILIEYITKLPGSPNQTMENVVGFIKLKLYEKKVSVGKEEEELSIQTLRNLKKKHIKEVLEDIASEFTPNERLFFERLMDIATTRRLEKRKANQTKTSIPGAIETEVT